jgi:putative copper export protein
MSPDALSVVLRALSFVVLLQAAGIAIFLALFNSGLVAAERDIRRLGRWSVVIAAALLAAQFSLEGARLAGDFGGLLDPTLQRAALASPAGLTLGTRLIALLLIGSGLSRPLGTGAALAVGGAVLAAASFALMGHTVVHPWRMLLAPALTGHVLIAAFWLGALPALGIVTLRESPQPATRVVEAFSKIAIWLVLALALLGIVMALILVRHLAVFRQPYGELLLCKVAAFALLMALAAANRLRLGPAVARGSAQPFRRSLLAEYVLLIAVLFATATLTTLYSPEP